MTSLSQIYEDNPRVARRRLDMDGAAVEFPRLPLAAYGPMPTVNAAATGREGVPLDHAVYPEVVEQCIPINMRAAVFMQQGRLRRFFFSPYQSLGRHIISRLPRTAYDPIRAVISDKHRLYEMKWLRRNRYGDALWGEDWPVHALWAAVHFGHIHFQWCV